MKNERHFRHDDFENTGLITLDEDLLQSIKLLDTNLARSFRRPTIKHIRELAQSISIHQNLFDAALATLDDGTTNPDNIARLTTYLRDFEAKRSQAFSAHDRLAAADTYTPEASELDELTEHIVSGETCIDEEGNECTASTSDHLVAYDAAVLQDSFSTFLDHSSEAYTESPSARYTKIAHTVGRHAVKALEIGAGVAAGIIIAKRSKHL